MSDKYKSEIDFKNVVMNIDDKLKKIKDIKNNISKKRIIFDESREKFGFDVMKQLAKVNNTSEIKGYPFIVYRKDDEKNNFCKYAVKVIPIETKYDKKQHPSTIEIDILKQLTEKLVDRKLTPHITYYLGSNKISNKSRSIKHLNIKKLEVQQSVRSSSYILISEYVDGGSLESWAYSKYENDVRISEIEYKGLIFQLIYTLAILQKKYRFMHNDFHFGNILIDTSIESGGCFKYTIDNKTFYIPNHGFIPKLWDFEYTMVFSNNLACHPNKFVLGPLEYDSVNHKTIEDLDLLDLTTNDEPLNVPLQFNETYDLHYFLTSLLDLYDVPSQVKNWITGLYPKELIPENENTESTYSSYYSSDSSNNNVSDNKSKMSDISSRQSSSERSSTNSSQRSSERSSSNYSSRSTDNDETEFLFKGRIKNEVEKQFLDLPTPFQLLSDDFFKEFLTKNDTVISEFNSGL